MNKILLKRNEFTKVGECNGVCTTNIQDTHNLRFYPVRQKCAKLICGFDHLVVLRGNQLKHTQFDVTLISRETTIYQFQIRVSKQQDKKLKLLKKMKLIEESYHFQWTIKNQFFRIFPSKQVDNNVEIIQRSENPTNY